MGKNYFGVALDMCRNAVMKVEEVKKYVDIISSFGYNLLQIYIEDTFEVDNEPFFGYMRGRYSKKELKEISDYCVEKGIEFVPNIQTLAHIRQIFRWPDYAEIRDFGDIMLAEEERTYQLIENMFKTLKENTSARIVNIGMDEAHMLGLGEYLDRHGYQNRFDILNRHLLKVMSICEKYGFEPVMWSDMFFRLANNGDYCPNGEVKLDANVKKILPENISLTYWDYYHPDKASYDKMFDAHKKLGKEVWFAGGAWSWVGFAPYNKMSMINGKSAMESAREYKVKNVIITLWGDHGKDCSYNNLLPALHFIAQTAKGVTDEKEIKESFKKITSVDYDEFLALDLIGQTKLDVKEKYDGWQSIAKALLYTDPFLGRFDYEVKNGITFDFDNIVKQLSKNVKNRRYGYLFQNLHDLAKVLEIKYDLGVRTRTAYQNGDKKALEQLVKYDYTEVVKRLKTFYRSFRAVWEKENKGFGFEVQDMRFGGLMLRIENCQRRLKDYLSGKTDRIEELEFEPLPMGDGDGRVREIRTPQMVSTSNV